MKKLKYDTQQLEKETIQWMASFKREFFLEGGIKAALYKRIQKGLSSRANALLDEVRRKKVEAISLYIEPELSEFDMMEARLASIIELTEEGEFVNPLPEEGEVFVDPLP